MLSEKVIKKVTKIGEIESLTTENRDNIVDAINEVNSKFDNVSSDAKSTTFNNSSNGMSATNVQNAIEENKLKAQEAYDRANEAFQSVSNGKSVVASAITDKGITTSNNDNFQTITDNIQQIKTGSSVLIDGIELT